MTILFPPDPIPVLMYHQVLSDSEAATPYVVSPQAFAFQLRTIQTGGFAAADLRHLLDADQQVFTMKRRVVITFDDGYADNYSTVFPMLLRAGATATFFVITEKISQNGFMTASELREMHAAGMSIQSHTCSHLPLAVLPDRLIRNELEDSKAQLEDILGAPVSLMSFPHGSYDERVLSIAEEAGYAACCSSDFEYFKNGANRYCIPRLVVRRGCNDASFMKLVRGDRSLLAKAKLMAETRSLVSRMIGVQRYQQLYNAYYGSKRELQ